MPRSDVSPKDPMQGRAQPRLAGGDFIRIEISAGVVKLCPADRRLRPLLSRAVEPLRGQPFLRWTGGKQWLAPALPMLSPDDYSRYFEPFLGGASAFFSLQPKKAYLTDANSELIRATRAVRDEPDRVISNLRRWKYDKEIFKEVRDLQTRTEASFAARFIYLNRTAFNGIYRVNREGKFNVPFGQFKNPTICNRQRIEACSKALGKTVLIEALDFEDAVRDCKKGDFVYFDPPYITGHMNNGFVKWNAKLFGWDDQERLATLTRTLAERGVHVLISNADHHAVSDLYSGFHRYRLERASQIGGPVSSRRRVSEILAASYPILGIDSLG